MHHLLPDEAPPPHPTRRAVFIVRLWRSEDGEDGSWRGEVQHVESGQRIALQSLAGLVQALQAQLNKPSSHHGLR